MTTQLEREAEEYADKMWPGRDSKSDNWGGTKDDFIAGWRACRAAIAKRRWNERVDTFDLATFGEEEAHEQASR